jgi:hypothetical protein
MIALTSLGRHLRSMGKPAEFELMEQSMREDFRRVRLKCETLLAQRVDELGEELKSKYNGHTLLICH